MDGRHRIPETAGLVTADMDGTPIMVIRRMREMQAVAIRVEETAAVGTDFLS